MTLYSFPCCDGPISSIVSGGKGAVFGTTRISAFALLSGPGGWTEDVLYDFVSDENPNGVISVGRVLYGTTYQGGASGLGEAFELKPAIGGIWPQTILHNFSGSPNDGSYPRGNLVMDSDGRFYGTTWAGGTANAGTVLVLIPPAEPGGSLWGLHGFRGDFLAALTVLNTQNLQYLIVLE